MGLFRKKDAPVAVDLPAEVSAGVDSLLARGEDIAAVKYVRDRTGLGMKPALDAVNKRKEIIIR